MLFFLCGFLIDNGWTWSWALLLISPFIESFLKLKNKSIKKAIASLLDMIIITLVIFLGFYFHIWSWCWVFFFLIPIAHINEAKTIIVLAHILILVTEKSNADVGQNLSFNVPFGFK